MINVGEGRIELPILHPQRSVLPLYYSPGQVIISGCEEIEWAVVKEKVDKVRENSLEYL